MDWTKYQNWQEVFDDLADEISDKTIAKFMIRKKIVEVQGNEFNITLRKEASALCRLGLQNKHIGIMGRNSYELFTALCATLYIGSVAVVICQDYTAEELRTYGGLAEIDAIICDHVYSDVCLESGLNMQIISLTDSDHEEVLSLCEERERGLVPIVNTTGRDDLINILFTSGTTGMSKGVMHTNASLISGTLNDLIYQEYHSPLIIFPFHHIVGYGFALVGLTQGKVLCFGESITKIFTYLECLKPDALFAVPDLLNLLCSKVEGTSIEALGWNIKLVICGAAKWPEETLLKAEHLGFNCRQSYGSSETIGRAVSAPVDINNLSTLGVVDPLMQVKFDHGELAVKGPCVCAGYYKNPKETEETFRDGWYYTGDLARIDEKGFIYLTGRKKNLIILSNGENVSPEEIENILVVKDEIKEIIVREEDHKISAVIYPTYGEEDSDEQKQVLKNRVLEIIEEYNENAMTYKQISVVYVVDEPLPKTSTGKLKRW